MRAFCILNSTPRLLVKARIPNPGSALSNPYSHKYKLRNMMASHAAQNEYFESQAEFANIGGTGNASVDDNSHSSNDDADAKFIRKRRAAIIGKTKKEQKQDFIQRAGAELAESVKSMTDGEWEAVPLEQKHYFVKYMAKILKEHPTRATEQQRRRYFETTMADPRSFNYAETVHEPYERMKMGLPFELHDTSRSSGIAQAIYDDAEASLFDPENVHVLRNAMTQVKQVFVDYVHKKREGKGTEHERRQLANMMAELNLETQRHVANMFKYAEAKLRQITLEEKRKQLSELARLRALVQQRRTSVHPESKEEEQNAHDNVNGTSNSEKEANDVEMKNKECHDNNDLSDKNDDKENDVSSCHTNNNDFINTVVANEQNKEEMITQKANSTKPGRRARLKRAIGKAMGVEYAVVDSLLHELEAQEKFMQFCEVFARLTLGKGFVHTADDETLDAYTQSLRNLYSVDAGKLSTLDVIQYLAAKDSVPPVEWARRWYERALLIPLQHTVEYQQLKEIQESERRALELKREMINAKKSEEHTKLMLLEEEQKENDQQEQQRQKEEKEIEKLVVNDTNEQDAEKLISPSISHEQSSSNNNTVATSSSGNTTVATAASVAAASYKEHKVINLVEKMFLQPNDPRLKSVHEKRLRYIAYLQMERQIKQARANAKRFEGVENTEEGLKCRELYAELMKRKAELCQSTERSNNMNSKVENMFTDPIASQLFEQIRDIAIRVMYEYGTGDKSATRAQKLANIAHKLTTESPTVQSLRSELHERQEALSHKLLSALEDDVKSEMEWLEAMEEAERPALLPIPEGMSYVSAADVQSWKEIRDEDEQKAASPFARKQRRFQSTLLGQPWHIPDKPMLFWGTGARAVQQALEHAADDAERRRRNVPLAPPYPCAENPWGWRLVKDILDDESQN